MNLKVLGILILLLTLYVGMCAATPDTFLKGNNQENLLRRTSLYGILAVGVAFVIITGGIDLSIGSIVCLTGCLLSMFLTVDYRAVGVESIESIRGDKIELRPGVRQYQTGDQIRFSGGIRADNARVRIVDIEHTGESTTFTVDRSLARRESRGRVTTFQKITTFSASGDAPTIMLAGSDDLQPRDRVTLISPDEEKEFNLTVVAAEQQAGGWQLTLNEKLHDEFSMEWVAVPIERSQRMPVVAAVCLTLLIAVVLGLVHGLLVTKVELKPFVVTLCGLLIYRGMSRWLVADQVQGFGAEFPGLRSLATGKLELVSGENAFGIPYPLFIMLFVALGAAVLLNKTVWGRYLQALGRNEEAAKYSGIDTHRVTIMAYVICTTLAALGGMLFALDSNSVSPANFGNFFELYAIAAAVLGGCSLRGGEGGILGVLIGTAVMRLLYNLIVLLGISGRLEFAIIGIVILSGVTADGVIQRLVAWRRTARDSSAAN
ncbi:MAG: ABC transporter permease [Pirellulaceae bacterium]|jgi:ribose transport system permease protein|nr:ABC transporter permease [Pirellulaceae bacterium]MDP7015781.1 ABC transporter permease [Pirellulaceae bacterium]